MKPPRLDDGWTCSRPRARWSINHERPPKTISHQTRSSSSSSSAVAEPCHNYNFDEVEFTCLLSLAIFQLSISAGSALRYGEGIGEKACANKTGEVHGLLEVLHVTHLKNYRAQ